jgi:hypothetical protein
MKIAQKGIEWVVVTTLVGIFLGTGNLVAAERKAI